MESASETLTLADLSRVLVAQAVAVEGEDEIAKRLQELGFCPGTEVRFERQAPFGGPIILSLRGYQLALRPSEAKRVRVQGISGAGSEG